MAIADRAAALAGLVRQVQALAAGVAVRARQLAWIALGAGAVAWLTLFARWAFDSTPKFLFFAIVLLMLLAPGLVLIGFARAVVGAIDTSESLAAEVAELAADGAQDVAAGLADVSSASGFGALASLLGSLWRLKDYRSDFGSIVSKVVGSTRLVNPLYLLWAAAAVIGAGFVVLLALAGVLVWAL